MDTTLLQYFLVVAKTQHMTKAAQQLNITQPSLSTAIRRLESELGMPLFDRVGRSILLNEYGKIFYTGAAAAIQSLNTATEEMNLRKKRKSTFVQLACSRSPVNSQLIDFLLAQGINLKIDTVPSDWEHQLLHHTCDLVVTAGISNSRELEKVVLCSQKLVIVASRSHPLAKSTQIDPAELNHYAFCSTGHAHSLLNVAKEPLSDLGISPSIAFWGHNSADMLKAIHTGQYLGLMVERNLPGDPDLVTLPVTGMSISAPIYLYWNKRISDSYYLPAIRQDIIDFYQELSP